MIRKEITVRAMIPDDWISVSAIYAEGIATKNSTFETNIPSWEVWDKSHLSICRFVAEVNKAIVGWAALSSVSSRCIYAGVAEASVYVAETARGQGIGTLLLNKLIADSEANDVWMLEAGIFPENSSSLALQKRCGFREVGYREKLGKLDGKWRDVMFFERRSKVIK